MDLVILFEQLAATAHHNEELANLLSHLPNTLKELFSKNDCKALRSQIAASTIFFDSRVVSNS